jgi:hypothetical protein
MKQRNTLLKMAILIRKKRERIMHHLKSSMLENTTTTSVQIIRMKSEYNGSFMEIGAVLVMEAENLLMY